MYILYVDLVILRDPGSLVFTTDSEFDGAMTPDTTISDKVNPPGRPILNSNMAQGKPTKNNNKKYAKSPKKEKAPPNKLNNEKKAKK